MAVKEIIVPDIGDFNEIPILEILVNRGDTVEKEQSLITLESDKATMEIPASDAGVVQELKVNVGDKVSPGTVILTLEVIEAETQVKPVPPPPPPQSPISQPSTATQPAISQQALPPASSRLSSATSDIRRPKNLPVPPVESIES
jgi:pyruvate/2-oxoglutarate dehydrogenase complex dihydrolipoamide acyltransferase (E2) component